MAFKGFGCKPGPLRKALWIAALAGALTYAVGRTEFTSAWEGNPGSVYVTSEGGNKAFRSTQFTAGSWSSSGNYYTLYVSQTRAYANIFVTSYQYSCANHNAWGESTYPTFPGDIHGVYMDYWNTPQYDSRNHVWYVDTVYSYNPVTVFTGLTNNQGLCSYPPYLARMYDYILPYTYSISSTLALDSTTFP